MKLLPFSALLALLCFPPAASAAYRCEKNGHILYTDQRCEDTAHASGHEIRVAPPTAATRDASKRRRSPGEPGETDTRNQADPLQREHAELRRLQALREQRERHDRQIRDLAARGAAARERKCKALSLQRQWREEDLRESPLDKADKARTRLRRANEKYDAECR